jgi:hypothetical protein
MAIRTLTSAAEVIDALYEAGVTKGRTPNKAFAAFISFGGEKRNDQNVSHYRNAVAKLPHYTYLVITKALEKIHCSAPPSLWGIADPQALQRSKRRAG